MNDIKTLSDTELKIMQFIWDMEPPVSRSDIEEKLCSDRNLAPSTIITFLSRMCEKGLLVAEHRGRTNYYTPLVSKQEYRANENRSFLNKLYGGSFSEFAVSLCNSGISKDDLAELKRMLEENDL